MNTLIRIDNISESMAEELIIEFNRSIPEFCKGTGKHAFEKDLYSFFLSSNDDDYWGTQQEEVIDKLSKISETLLHAKSSGASLSINTCIHMSDYRDAMLVDFVFSSELLQLAAKIGADLEVSLYTDNPCWNCQKNEDDDESHVGDPSDQETD